VEVVVYRQLLYDALKNAVDRLIAQYLPSLSDQPPSPSPVSVSDEAREAFSQARRGQPTAAPAAGEDSPEWEGSEDEDLDEPTGDAVGAHGAGASAFDDPNDPALVRGSPRRQQVLLR